MYFFNLFFFLITLLVLNSCKDLNSKKVSHKKNITLSPFIKNYDKIIVDSLEYSIISQWIIDSVFVNNILEEKVDKYLNKAFQFDNELNYFELEKEIKGGNSVFFNGKYLISNDSIFIKDKGRKAFTFEVIQITINRLIIREKEKNKFVTFVCHRNLEWIESEKIIKGPWYNIPINKRSKWRN